MIVNVTYGIYKVKVDVPEGATMAEIEEAARKVLDLPEEVVAHVYPKD